MKIPNNNTPCYPLTTMQQTDLHGKMFRFNVGTYVCLSFTLNFKLEFSIMERAIALEYERNDCLRQRFFKAGRTWKQFFLKQCVSPKVEYIDFRKSAKISQHDFFERESARFIPFDANML